MQVGWRYALILPVVLYLSLSTLYLFAIPSGESPDEPSHLRCIEQVAIEHRLPEIDPPPTGEWWTRSNTVSGYLCYHMPLYYLLSGFIQQVTHTLSGDPLHFELPPNNPEWGRSSTPVMFSHAPKSSFFQVDAPPSVIALRLTSILLGLASVLAAAAITRHLLPESAWAPAIAATLIAGWPQFLFMSRAINNDVLATALAAIVLIILLDVWRPRRFAAAGAFACLAMFAKLTMIFTAIVVVMVYGVEFVTAKARRREYIFWGLIGLIPAAILAAAIIWQPTLRQHFDLAQAVFSETQPDALTLPYWLDALRLTLSSGWVRFGWMNVATPDWQAYVWWGLIGAATVLGIGPALSRSEARPTRTLALILGMWMLSMLAGYVRINLNRFQPQFRFLFPLLPVVAAFASIGYLRLVGASLRRQRLAFAALAIALLLINLWILFAIVQPTYAQ